MKRGFRKAITVLTAVLMALMMTPAFSFAGTYSEKVADGEYHYTALGDSIAAGRGPAETADEAFLALGYKAGRIEYTLNASPEGGYVNLLADMLNNHICSKPEGTSNFRRNSSGNWERVDDKSIFTFSNAATVGVGTRSFMELMCYDMESDKPTGTNEYYEDLFMKNFCNDKGEYISNTPVIFTLLSDMFLNEDGTTNKAAFGYYCSILSNIYSSELKKTDVMTIGLGANDLLIESIVPLFEVLKGDQSGIFAALSNTILGMGADFSEVDLSKMSNETMISLLEFAEPAAFVKRADKQVEEGLECYEKILEKISSEKKGNDSVALVGLYKPYGEEFVSGGKKNVLPVVTGDILDSLSDLVESSEYKELSELNVKTSSASSSALEDAIFSWITKKIYAETGVEFVDLRFDKEQLERILKEFKGDSSEYKALFKKMLKNRTRYRSALREAKGANEAQKALITEMLTEKIRMPLMYALLGTSTEDATEKYNAGIEKLADKFGYRFVDVSDLPADNDPNPHPDLAGHQIIAERVFAALKDVVPPEIKASDIRSLKTSAGKGYLKVRYSAADKGKVTGYTVQYKVKGDDKWKKFKDTEKTSVKIKGLKKGKKYAVRVRTYSRNSFETARGKWKGAVSKKVK